MTQLELPAAAGGTRRLRVAVVSSAALPEAYVAAVLPREAGLSGPVGVPSPWLSAEFLEAHAADIDLLHVHDVPPGPSPRDLEVWGETARRLGVPVVATVHQLRDALDRGGYAPALAALLTTAEVVLTLTPGAADEIAERYARTAIVVAHPSVAMPVPELGAERGLVGLVLGRRSGAIADPLGLVRAARSGAISGGGRLRVLAEPGPALPLLCELSAEDDVELRVHPGPGSGDWPAQLQELHVAVLPERGWTHSSDLETCRDVGTRVVAPGSGWFTGQWSEVVGYADDDAGEIAERGFDAVSVAAAVGVALTRPAPRPADQAWRAEQRAAVQRVHGEVYAQVAAD